MLRNVLVSLPLICAALLAACNSPTGKETAQSPPGSAAVAARPEPVSTPAETPTVAPVVPASETGLADVAAADTADQYATMYVVVADTNLQYRPLHRQMLRLHAATGQRIDTMGRFFDPQKNLIRLPDDDEDELYAGDYFPRRMPDATLSLEYTDLYTRSRPKSMALVAGIYQEPARADSALAALRQSVPTAFRVKTRLFMGCMH